jgi:hypothetical protein
LYCPNCAHKLKSPNENYCHYCGISITGLFINRDLEPEKSQVSISIINDRFAKYCLVYALISSAFLGFGFFLSSGLFFLWFILRVDYYNSVTNLTLIVIIVLNGIGLIFAVVSVYHSKKARYTDLRNILERIGRPIGIISIITNAIALILANIILGIQVFLILTI